MAQTGRERPSAHVLRLRVGDRVEVRSVEEILASLDERGALDELPFMPEMLEFSGQRFTVFKRADKVNDIVERSGLRRMGNAVLLDEVRCDGMAHGGCQALCQILWKEAWLKRAPAYEEPPSAVHESGRPSSGGSVAGGGGSSRAEDLLMTAAHTSAPNGEPVFSCQATEIRKASSYLVWWDVTQYVRDLRSGNVGVSDMMRAFCFWLFTLLLRVPGYRVWVALYEALQRIRGGDPFPFRQGKLTRTPSGLLHLRPGEVVEVKKYDEILATLDASNKNRGLAFDREMIKYCGGRFKVLSRVGRLIDPKSGRMLTLTNDSIILEGVTTKGDYHQFYPQNEYPLWREIWLRRIGNSGGAERKRDA
jgi:hypothetical protein